MPLVRPSGEARPRPRHAGDARVHRLDQVGQPGGGVGGQARGAAQVGGAERVRRAIGAFRGGGRATRLAVRRAGQVASTSPARASAKAAACPPPKGSPSTSTPTAAALTGSITVNTPAAAAGTWRRPVIHSHTVTMLAASA